MPRLTAFVRQVLSEHSFNRSSSGVEPARRGGAHICISVVDQAEGLGGGAEVGVQHVNVAVQHDNVGVRVALVIREEQQAVCRIGMPAAVTGWSALVQRS